MAEKKVKIKTEKVRLPDELMTGLRQAASVYGARGEKSPALGDLLLDAWRRSGLDTVPGSQNHHTISPAPVGKQTDSTHVPQVISTIEGIEAWEFLFLRAIMDSANAVAKAAIRANLIIIREYIRDEPRADNSNAAAAASHAVLLAAATEELLQGGRRLDSGAKKIRGGARKAERHARDLGPGKSADRPRRSGSPGAPGGKK